MSSAMLAKQTRHEAVEALEVVLADGNLWGLELPSSRRYPVFIHESDAFGRPQVRIEVRSKIGYRLEIRRLWESVLATSRDGSAEEQSETFRRLVTALLRSAHDIDPSQADSLLDPRRVDLGRIARAVIPAAFGQGDPYRFDGR